MLTATRDDAPHPHAVHYGAHTPPRTLASRFTGAVQLLGSLVGIPLALIGGYSTYHATFSPEGKCQALRANIVSMLDKKTDASTLRLLVQRDVVTFERECGEVDADAAAAFKTLLAADKPPAAVHRPVAAVAKTEKPEKIEKAIDAAMASAPAKTEKAEPLKRDAVKRDTPLKEAVVKETPKDTMAKAEPPKAQLGAPPHPLVAPERSAPAAPQAAAPAEKIAEPEKPAAQAAPATPVTNEKPVEAAAVQQPAPPEKANVDATWVASVRDALRESASQPAAAETTSDVAPTLAAPIDISPDAQVARRGNVAPPAEMGQWRPSAPRPPGLIPNAN